METEGLTDVAWNEIWRPDIIPYRKVALREQLKACWRGMGRRVLSRGSEADNPIIVA